MKYAVLSSGIVMFCKMLKTYKAFSEITIISIYSTPDYAQQSR